MFGWKLTDKKHIMQDSSLLITEECKQFSKWLSYFNGLNNFNLSALTNETAEIFYLKLLEQHDGFIQDRKRIKDLEITNESLKLMRDQIVDSVNESYSRNFQRILNEADKIRNQSAESSNIDENQPYILKKMNTHDIHITSAETIIYTPEELNAKTAYENWKYFFNKIKDNPIDLDFLSMQDCYKQSQEFQKKSEEFINDNIKYFNQDDNSAKSAYIEELRTLFHKHYQEIFVKEHSKIREIIGLYETLKELDEEMKILCQAADLLNEAQSLEINVNKIFSSKNVDLLTLDGKTAKYKLNLIKKSNLKLNEKIISYKGMDSNSQENINKITTTFTSKISQFPGYLKQENIAILVKKSQFHINIINKIPETLKEVEAKVQQNTKLIESYFSKVDFLQIIKECYDNTVKILSSFQNKYQNIIYAPKTNITKKPIGNLNQLISLHNRLKQKIQDEKNTLQQLNELDAKLQIRAHSAFKYELAKVINLKRLDDSYLSILDLSSKTKVKLLDNDYKLLRGEVSAHIEQSKKRIDTYINDFRVVQQKLLRVEEEGLTQGHYDEVKCYKFKIIQNYILENSNFKELMKLGAKKNSPKSELIQKYKEDITNATNLGQLLQAVNKDPKLDRQPIYNNKPFSMRANTGSGWYGYFFRGQSTYDGYALNLYDDLIKFIYSTYNVEIDYHATSNISFINKNDYRRTINGPK